MKAIARRVTQLETQSARNEYEAPVIITWIIEPGKDCSWACAWIKGPTREQFWKAEGESMEAFEERVCLEVDGLKTASMSVHAVQRA